MKKAKKILGVVLVVAMAVSMFAGCGAKTSEHNSSSERKLEYWLGNNVSSYVSDYNDAVALQEIQKLVDIEVEFVHPSSAAWEEQFNIMMAAQDYPALVQYNWGTKYAGGYDGAFADDIILDLTPYTDKLPNYSKVLNENPEFAKTVKTTDGKMLYFATMTNDTVTNANMGPMIRKDWLDKVGLDVPTTIEEWYTVLKAFKTQDPNGNGQADEIPFAAYKSPGFNWLAPAYGTKKGDVFVKDGKVVYGSIQPEFKEFVTEMNKWYNEGLIDTEFAALEKSIVDANMTNDISGATLAYIGGSMGNYISARKGDGSGYNLVGAPWPSKVAGAPNYIGTQQSRLGGSDVGTVITTNCNNLDVALEFMDFMFSEEATILQNWGIEGKTYTVDENGKYKLTDFVLNNPDGLSPVEAMTPIAFTAYGVPARIIDGEAYSQVQYSMPAQAEAAVLWSEGDDSLMTLEWPMTAEEKARVSEIKTAISTYEDEMYTKMIMGKEPISKFDAFVSEMKARGVDEMVQIYQTAYDRFLAE